MRVLVLNLWPISPEAIGGTERFVVDLAEGMVAHGHRVDVGMISGEAFSQRGVWYLPLSLGGSGKFDEHVLREKFFPDFSEARLHAFAELIESEIDLTRYDAIHVNSLLMWFVARAKPRVFAIHTNPFELEKDFGIGSFDQMAAIIRDSMPNKTRLTAPSAYFAREYECRFGHPVSVIPHGIDPDRLRSEKSRGELVQTYGLDPDLPTILVPSRLEPEQKGQDLLLPALSQVRGHLPRYQVIFTGLDTQYWGAVSALRKIADQLEIPVHFIAFPEMSDAYTLADLVALPSKSESFGYAALEALTLGIPAVLSDIPPFREIAEGHPGAHLAARAPEEFGTALIAASRPKILHDVPPAWRARYAIGRFTESHLSLLGEASTENPCNSALISSPSRQSTGSAQTPS